MTNKIMNRWLELMLMPEKELKKIRTSRRGDQFNLHKISNDIDWNRMTNVEISKATNISKQTVEHFRNRNNLPYSPYSPKVKEFKREFWKMFDWKNHTNKEISEKFHLYNPVWISTMRHRYAPNTIRKYKRKWKGLIKGKTLGSYIIVKTQIEANNLRQAGLFCTPRRKVEVHKIKGKDKFRCRVLLKKD